MSGLFNIILSDNKYLYHSMIANFIKNLGYNDIRTFIEPVNIKIYCHDEGRQYLVCDITNEDVVINKRFPELIRIFREIKIEYLNG